VANGDLFEENHRPAFAAKILELKNTINTMVDQLSASQLRLTRVARESAPKASSAGQGRRQGRAGTGRI